MEQTQNTEFKLEEPINFTDPYVLHDVQQDKPVIVKLYQPNDIKTDNEEDIGNNNQVSSIKSEGLLYPVVQINTQVISSEQIIAMVLNYNDFLPTIKITILDQNELIQRTDIPGYNNTLRVAIIPEVQNVYKSISLDFKITSVETDGEYITYSGQYKVLEFNKKRIKEVIYPGCSNKKEQTDENGNVKQTVKCNPNENKQPNTWELLHTIANECKLGFSSTDHCQDVLDTLPRLIYNKNYESFIYEQMLFSGLDENSIFDAWVDLYGYLVMVNVAWVLNNETVTGNNLGIYAFTGIHGTDDNHEPEQEAELVPRTLTNHTKIAPINNLSFQNFNVVVDNSELIFGTSTSMYNFELLDVGGGNNAISQYDVEIIRDSVDDKRVEDYAVQNQERLVIECNNLPINKQKLIRKKFFAKHRQRILEIELNKLNLGLQRGTLINVMIFEDNPRNKQFLLSQTSNVFAKEPKEEIKDEDLIPDNLDESNNNEVLSEGDEIMNMGLSGMYYIDSMRFEYTSEQNEIKQYLNLIKKSNLNNLANLTTPFKVDTTQNTN